MRSRVSQFACLLLLLSSLAVSSARAGVVEPSRTPGGVFVRNLLLRAVVEDAEPGELAYGREDSAAVADVAASMPVAERWVAVPVTAAAHVHAVTGSSL
jgi:hypothetical protein